MCPTSGRAAPGPGRTYSMSRNLRQDEHTTCTALAPEAVFTGAHVRGHTHRHDPD
jgi:hypothetical protein